MHHSYPNQHITSNGVFNLIWSLLLNPLLAYDNYIGPDRLIITLV
jgi:hypothetical protein